MYKWLVKANPQLDGKYARPLILGLLDPNHRASDFKGALFESPMLLWLQLSPIQYNTKN
jgi:hypothetical protein